MQCPYCHKNFKLIRGDGAAYVKDMSKLSAMAFTILKWWNSSPKNIQWLSKRDLYYSFGSAIRLFPNDFPKEAIHYQIGSFAARVSELVGLGVAKMSEDKRTLKDFPTMTFRHSGKPRYLLNKERAEEILANNGFLGGATSESVQELQ